MFPYLRALANACMSGTTSSFSKMKMIKLDSETDYLSYLMKISIESLQKLTDEDLEMMIEIWNRKTRRIVV